MSEELAKEIEHHEMMSKWPFLTGLSGLMVMFGFMAGFQWRLEMVGLLLAGAGVVGVLVSLFGWVSEVHAEKQETGLSKFAIVIFILSEVALFGGLFSGYLYNMFPASIWPPSNTPAGVPPLGFAIILTVVLLLSSVTIQIAESKLDRGDKDSFKTFLILTMFLGALFLAGQAREWTKLIGEGFTVSTNAYGTFFYVITGFHGSHVLVGVILQLFVLLLVVKGTVSEKRQTILKACGYYWHFVDGVWLLVLSLIYVLPMRY